MKRGTIRGLLGTIVVAGFSLGAFADVKENPYQVIIERNPFGLKPIPPPPEPPKQEVPITPPPEIKLTGITTLSGAPKAFLQVEDKQTKKAAFPPPLAAGDNFNEITVVSIDVENNTVRIKNGDAETTLDFVNNGVKATATASAAPAPHPGIMPLNPPGVPGLTPPATGATAPGANTSARGAIVSGGYSPTASAAPNAIYNNTGLGNLPQRPVRTDNLSITAGGNQPYNPNPQPTVHVPTPMSRDQAEAMIEAQRKILLERQQAGQAIPTPPSLLPPTRLGQSLNVPSPVPPSPR